MIRVKQNVITQPKMAAHKVHEVEQQKVEIAGIGPVITMEQQIVVLCTIQISSLDVEILKILVM